MGRGDEVVGASGSAGDAGRGVKRGVRDKQLRSAAMTGDMQEVERLLREGASVRFTLPLAYL